MELRYSYALIIGIIASLVIILLTRKKKEKFQTGSKMANTSYIKKSDIYKKLLRQYYIRIVLLYILLATSLISSLVLISRPSLVSTDNDEDINRDIVLCMDVSGSMDELNGEMTNTLKETVSNLKGERFGITIFNSSAVKIVPLTDDYDYVLDVLDTLHRAFTYEMDFDDEEYYYLSSYLNSGTLEGENGSSLIGDGLTSCVFNFSEDEDRTKIIIFTTDNELAGNPLVTLSKAADISKKKNVIVYGVAPEFMIKKTEEEFRAAVKKTGGKYYSQRDADTIKNIVNDIESTSKSLIKGLSTTRQIDTPMLSFIVLIISLAGVLILSKKVLK